MRLQLVSCPSAVAIKPFQGGKEKAHCARSNFVHFHLIASELAPRKVDYVTKRPTA